MKRFIFCLMTMLLTFTVVSARDVGVPLQTDVGYTPMVPALQHSDFTPAFADVAFETAQVVQVRAVSLVVNNQKVVRLCNPPVYCNPDYGSYRYNRYNRFDYSTAGLRTNTNKIKSVALKTAKQIPKL